jgi:signal transduction histidine kinase
MARTWSAPARASFVSFAPRAHQQRLFLQLADIGRGDPQRGLLLLIAALLTACGLVVPHIDADTLSTLLFLAGAGLAATLILSHSRPATPVPGKGTGSAVSSSPIAIRPAHPSRFDELVAKSRLAPTLDRAAWARLTAHMSHELRTPLNAVLGFSELMSNEVFGPLGASCYGTYARDIHASGRMLLKSAEDALAITALLTAPEGDGRPQLSCLATVLDDAGAFARHDFGIEALTVTSEIAPEIEVIGDPQATRQMLINLLTEVRRHARNGATIAVGAHTTADTVKLSFALAREDVADVSNDESFPMILARTLCELSGAALNSAEAADGGREWTVDFVPAAQCDLFAARPN